MVFVYAGGAVERGFADAGAGRVDHVIISRVYGAVVGHAVVFIIKKYQSSGHKIGKFYRLAALQLAVGAAGRHFIARGGAGAPDQARAVVGLGAETVFG